MTRRTRRRDVASTTTDQGVTLPFIVRVETGYIDRDKYQIDDALPAGQDVERDRARRTSSTTSC